MNKNISDEQKDFLSKGLASLGLAVKSLAGGNPTENNSSQYSNNVFSIKAFYWGEEQIQTKEPNFKYEDLEIRWYKYLPRSLEVNRVVSESEWLSIVTKCLDSLKENNDK